MCGRGACTLSAARCRHIAGSGTQPKVRGAHRLRSRYNLGPQGYVPVVRCVQDSEAPTVGPKVLAREVCVMQWGLVPAFAKRAEDYDAFRGGSSTFNARFEGVESSGLWRRLVDDRRCVVLLDGFYEWRAEGKSKVPMFIRNPDDFDGHTIPSPAEPSEPVAEKEPATEATGSEDSGKVAEGPRHAPLLLAGLWDSWQPSGGSEEPLESVTLLTTDSDGTPVARVHDRMPVMLTPETAALWLDPRRRFHDIAGAVLKTARAHACRLHLYEVAPLVSHIKNESPDCILPKRDYDARQLAKGLGRFFKRKSPEPCTAGPDSATAAGQEPGPPAKRLAGPAPAAIHLD